MILRCSSIFTINLKAIQYFQSLENQHCSFVIKIYVHIHKFLLNLIPCTPFGSMTRRGADGIGITSTEVVEAVVVVTITMVVSCCSEEVIIGTMSILLSFPSSSSMTRTCFVEVRLATVFPLPRQAEHAHFPKINCNL